MPALVPLFSALGVVAAALSTRPPTVELQNAGTTARLQAVHAVDDRVVWASGTGGTWARTTDGGKTWRSAVVPGADSLEFRDVHAFDADRAVLLASGTGAKSRFYRTTDGGRSWTLVLTNDEPAGFWDCFDFQGATGYALGDAVRGRLPLLRTTDGGASWAPWSPPGAAGYPAVEGEGGFAASGTCLALHPDGSVWVGTATTGRAVRFGADGVRAAETPIANGNFAGVASIAFRDATVGIAAGGNLGSQDFMDNVAVTADGGATWTLGGRPTFPGGIYGVAYVGSRPSTVVAVGPKGASWSDDNGKTWASLDGGDWWGISFTRSGVGWIGGPGGRIAKVTF